ncbi:MAG: T9SS type A sorting domain-containing protein [Calditrichaceae bacterium]|nr:T9SS type A sorting domain-containing protein [Calditrichaceae bacterium]
MNNLLKKTFTFLLIMFVSAYVSHLSAQGAGSGLDFESGATQFVLTGSHSSLQIAGDLTLEFWLNPETIQDQVLIFQGAAGETEAANTLYSIRMSPAGTITLTFEYGAGVDEIATSTSTISAASWTHVAVVRDAANTQVLFYLNGISETVGYTNNATGGSSSIGALGAAYVGAAVLPYDGILDEVRIWNDVRSQAEIRDNMNRVLTGTESNLIAYWPMDDGSGQVVTDYQSSGNNDGTLGATSGSGTDDPAWVTSAAPIGENSAFVITTDPTSVGPAGGDVTVTITSTPDASNNLMVYQFGSVSGAPVTSGETFPGTFDRRSNLVWGVQEIGDVTATLIFDYSNQVGVGDPSTVELLVRDDANDLSWTEVTESSRDNVARTITLTGVTDFSEFAIGGIMPDNPLPVDLITFTAIGKNGSVLLKWETSSEIENQGFEIYRAISENGVYDLLASYDNHAELESKGSSSRGYKYFYADNDIMPGQTYYYKLVDVDYNGYRTEHGPVLAIFSEANLEQVADAQLNDNFRLSQNYPNPFNPQTTIEFTLPENLFDNPQMVTLSVYNIQGKLVKNLLHSIVSSGQYKIFWNGSDANGRELASGIYIYQLRVPDLNISQSRRMMFLK